MSYDIYFRPGAPLPVAALKRYFSQRPCTTVADGDADYDNPETGVHFQWWFGPPEPGDDADDPVTGTQATMSVNFNRPSIFIREATREAEAFARTFDMQMIDLQADGKALPFDAGKLARDYLASAQSVTSRLVENLGTGQPPTLPRARIEEIWAWNDRRETRYTQLDDDLFLPKIMLFDRGGHIETVITWGDGVPMCFPRVDTVLCLRRDTAPRTGFFRKRQQDLVELLPFDTFLADFGDLFPPSDRFGGTWASHSSDGPALRARLTARATRNAQTMSAWKDQSGATILPFHAILDREFFDAAT